MTPGARIQSSIELLEQIFAAWQSQKRFPADKLLDQYFKSHRYIGSKDRASIGELVYWVLRQKASLEWWLAEKLKSPVHARAMVLTALMLRKEYSVSELDKITQDSKYALPKLTAKEKERCEALLTSPLPLAGEGADPALGAGKAGEGESDAPSPGASRHPLPRKGGRGEMPDHARLNYPQWLEPELRDSLGDDFEKALAALNEQASTNLRVNTLKTTREKLIEELAKESFEARATTLSPMGLRLLKRAPIFTSSAFKHGHFEVQDEGSQLVALLVEALPGQKVIDFCAGAGGKTLAIAAVMKNKGRILALDTSEKRLKQLAPRLRRAGVDNVQTHVIASENDPWLKRHKASADWVLVDAPCSGTGTWRRNPDLKWRFTQKDLDEVTALQQSILHSAAKLVRPGGKLIYATCSILQSENERQVEEFLKSGNNFMVVPVKKLWDKNAAADEVNTNDYLRLAPHQDGVDGFFAAVFERGAEKERT